MNELTHTYKTIAIYGLGTETERLISQWGDGPNIVGLLDGFKETGEIYGYPIISLQQAIAAGVELILVVARPGSCKVIAKRIKKECEAHNIRVYDVRGNDLLEEKQAKYDFRGIQVYTKQDLQQHIDDADVISFDLFDTLITRKVLNYTDIFELGLPAGRLEAEKALSVNYAPKLEEIYAKICPGKQEELAQLEWELDSNTFVPRDGMKEILEYVKSKNKTVIITSDSYYSKSQIANVLTRFGLDLFDELFVSCEFGKSKANGLFEIVKEKYPGQKILHIGDDEYVDVEKAKEAELDYFHIYGAKDLYDALGGFEFDQIISSYSDRVKVALMLSKLFSNPFQFESNDSRIQIKDARNIGYFICGPMLVDFALWYLDKLREKEIENSLLCARDGYLMEKIFDRLKGDSCKKFVYFLTSRISIIRAGIESQADLDYVDSMKFFGSDKDNLMVRFGISLSPDESREDAIINKAKEQRENYKKYIETLGLSHGKTAVFDFVAKGTTQLFLKKLMTQELEGLYFLQLEPEFMADKGLSIESFYTEAEKDKSVIFDNYYILETILTAPTPSVDEFDGLGQPVYAQETRTESNLACVSRMQEGILEFIDDYLSLIPEKKRVINKPFDEAMLSLIGKLEVTDEKFKELVVEDPFFGRMTKIIDVM